jgi:DNA-binding transcriptional MerR regulator/methylmalonyl-CoA mutase cobalamin-binding subunit
MYRIHVVAEKTGVSTQLLRAWERRYRFLSPPRTESGYRLYSDDDVAILRGAKVLVDEGRSISEVARLPHAQLRRAAARQPPARIDLPTESWQEAALAAIAKFDGSTLERLLLNATAMGALPGAEVCDRVLMPLLVAIGDRWENGSLDVAAEHFGSSTIRRHLHALVEGETRRNVRAPAVVCACPEGDLHEGGLLGFAVHAAVLGWSIVYLGPNTPVADLIATADSTRATAIALSMTSPRPQADRRKLISRLAAWRSAHDRRRVWVGGRAAITHAKELARAQLEFLSDAGLLSQTAG